MGGPCPGRGGRGGSSSLVGFKTSEARKLLTASHGTYFGNRVPTKLTPGSAAKLYLGTA